MNAVIALCHFCEAHGPCAIFCTQTLRDTKLEDLPLDQQQQTQKSCSACNYSMGRNNSAIYSRDTESGATFVSTKVAVLPEVANLVKQAAVLSLSNGTDASKDGEFVFFGDSARGHILSHTFRLSDLQARGYSQLFSIIVLMKDKYFLLNIKPFLAEHLKKVSSELQAAAKKTKETEESTYSERQRRLSGAQFLMHTSRSLLELTGEEHIFAQLHSHFSWLLLAGSRFLTEHVTFGNLPWLPPRTDASKDGEFVFFGDSARGHILSHTFRLSDLQARGYSQLFSIIVLMKDKYFLLNIKPFLAEHLKKVSSELQAAAKKTKETEESTYSERQRRLSGAQFLMHTSRSLLELTGEEHIFAQLHSHFSWLLLAGSRFLTEHVTFGNLPWLPPQSSGRPPAQRLTYNRLSVDNTNKVIKNLSNV